VPGPARRAMKQSEIVARHISQQIIAQGLPEGTRLDPEKTMVEEYQVGRSTLREALRLLENRGVLSIKTGREGGPVVRRPRPSDLGEAISLTLRFDGVPPDQVFTAQSALAARLVRRAAERVSQHDLAAMGECLDRMERYADQHAVVEAESRRFHEILAKTAESPVLAILVSAVDSVLDGLREDEPVGNARRSPRSTGHTSCTNVHRRIYDALAARDGDAAAAAMTDLAALRAPSTRGSSQRRRGVRAAARARSPRTGERSA
jgi:DNA-binding FadR family transcriptional regulator